MAADFFLTFLRADILFHWLSVRAGGTARSVLRQVRQSLDRDDAAELQPRLTSDLHGGCGTTLTNGLERQHHWQAGLHAAARRPLENS